MNFALDDEKLNKSNVKVNLLLERSKTSTFFVIFRGNLYL